MPRADRMKNPEYREEYESLLTTPFYAGLDRPEGDCTCEGCECGEPMKTSRFHTVESILD